MAFKPLVTVENITLHRPMRSVFHTLFDLDFDISRADTEDSQVKRFFSFPEISRMGTFL